MPDTAHSVPRPLVLVILDGFGHSTTREANAILLAKTPALDALRDRCPHTLIGTSGPDVGLPVGQMGNSEVGHLNFGAGRIAQMDISKIDCAIADGTLARNSIIAETVKSARERGGALHLLGLVSDGGVHSSLDHCEALIDFAAGHGVKVWLHAFLDGRDVPPKSAEKYLARVETHLAGKGAIATMTGRYWAMDRDKRWERVQKAFDAIVHARAPRATDWRSALASAYDAGQTDEFVEPRVLGEYAGLSPQAHDAGHFFNFRPDRAREISLALTAADFSFFDRGERRAFSRYSCMTLYDEKLGLPVAFPKEQYVDIFPELVARAGRSQFRCAETEKYAHVTYFFNGGREATFDGEERKLIPSPKDVATYDKKPEMSAPEVTRSVVEAVRSKRFDFVLVNYANPDMVGHTGVLPAAIAAVETVDHGLAELMQAVRAVGGAMIVTADHGNCELMVDPVTGAPHTAHTTNPVPLYFLDSRCEGPSNVLRAGGRICDVAPTMLQLMGLAQPSVMTGHSLIPADYKGC